MATVSFRGSSRRAPKLRSRKRSKLVIGECALSAFFVAIFGSYVLFMLETTTVPGHTGPKPPRTRTAQKTPAEAAPLASGYAYAKNYSENPHHSVTRTSNGIKAPMHGRVKPTPPSLIVNATTKDANTNTSTGTNIDARSNLLEKTVRETTRILYKDSPILQKRWLSARLPKIFFYDTLPQNWTNIDLISECIDDKFYGKPFFATNKSVCAWKPTVCDDDQAVATAKRFKMYANYKTTFNTDIAYQAWFQGYPAKTRNASEADLFLVPYPHKSHCLCNKDFKIKGVRCSILPEVIIENVVSKLTHYPAKKERHVFLFGVDWGKVPRKLRLYLDRSMSISLGDAAACRGKMKQLCGHFVTPYLSRGAAYQPDALSKKSEDWWTVRKRAFSVGAVLSTRGSFLLRVELMKNSSIHLGDSVGGLPLNLVDLGESRKQILPSDMVAVYNESIFCPILPGDGCAQKRFFDVILNGCIPVVPIFHKSDDTDGYPTFFRWEGLCSIRRTYPFARGTFFGDETAGIDYQSLVVTFDGFCGIACMKGAMDQVLSNTTELKRLQISLKDYAKLATFGLDDNMYRSVDAFAAMLVQLRHYVFKLDEKNNVSESYWHN